MKSLNVLKILLLSLVLSGCPSAPNVNPCVIDAVNSTCLDTNEQEVPVKKMDNFVCMSPDDTQRLLEWGKRRCKQ